MPQARNESPVTGRIADFRLQRLIAVGGKYTTKEGPFLRDLQKY